MRTESVLKNLRVLGRANAVMAEIHIRHAAFRTALTAIAILVGLLGVLLLEYAAYLALEDVWRPVWAALALGAANLVVAAILLALASRQPPQRDLELAGEVHRAAMDALLVDMRATEMELGAFRAALTRPWETFLPPVLLQLATLLLGALKGRGKSA